jgi:rubrerythrin
MTKQELIRQIRKMITAEYGAIADYTTLAEQCDDELAKKVLISIANEERVHAGEFISLLIMLDPEEEKYYTKGSEEVDKL